MNKEYTVQVSDLELTMLKIALSMDIKHMEAAQKRDVKNIFVSEKVIEPHRKLLDKLRML